MYDNAHLATMPFAQITSKERDAETGLDFFLARYYSAAQGRFLSPDEFKGGPDYPFTGAEVELPGPLPYADITNPQSINKYTYTYNNPLSYIDPDGHQVAFENARQAMQAFVLMMTAPNTFGKEVYTAAQDNSMDVRVKERHFRQNSQKSNADADIYSTNSNGVTRVDIWIDSYRTAQDSYIEEWGHEKDARTMGGTAYVKENKTELQTFPSPDQHNERPLEKSAMGFVKTVNKELEQTRKEMKQRKQLKKEEIMKLKLLSAPNDAD